MRERAYFGDRLNPPEMTLGMKFRQMNWGLLLLLTMISSIGFAMLYSAANGDWSPWAYRQMIRYGLGLVLTMVIAMIDVRVVLRFAYGGYAVALVLLAGVEIMGEVGMGAQRWINLGFFQLQPSELMKIALVVALARYFHGLSYEEVGRPLYLLIPILMIAAPVVVVLRQPALGTALMIIAGGGVLFVLAGVRIWKFVTVIILAVGSVPVAWQFLREYQRKRILTFLDPESDPLGSGYHILQSKIALGSGGIFGKGFLQGSQSHLNFLPEKQTDFVFTMLAEEFGIAGGLALIVLYGMVLAYGIGVSLMARNQFGRLVALGVTTTLFLYVFINIAMVMGLLPVVGVPLPLMSYGGTAMLTVMIGFGLVMSVYVHRDVRISRQGLEEDD